MSSISGKREGTRSHTEAIAKLVRMKGGLEHLGLEGTLESNGFGERSPVNVIYRSLSKLHTHRELPAVGNDGKSDARISRSG
jgi:hypothetical protein